MNTLYHLTFFDILEQNALSFKQDTAVRFNEQEETYQTLFDRTCRLGAGLRGLNLPPRARIAVLAKNHPAFFHLFGAASALNLCLVLINRRLTHEETAHVIQDTTPSILICDRENQEPVKKLIREHAPLTRCFTMDGSMDDLYADTPFVPSSPDEEAPYAIIHTAAVQGKPRGAVLSQKNIILSNLQVLQTFGMGRGTTYLNVLPLFHIMGVNFGLATLMAGGKNVVTDHFDPSVCIDLIERHGVNLFGSFPPILSKLYDCLQEKGTALPSLRAVTGIETPEMVKKWEAATSSVFWAMYGQTETSGLISFAPYFEQPGSAGRILPLARLGIADDQGNLLAQDRVGEILLRGPLVFKGYWQADELNALTFRQGWHHTGDLGMIDTSGYLHFKGRKPEKELIKPGGENVFPAEVEQAIMAHEYVTQVCVFGVPDPDFGEGIKAVCTLARGKSLTREELIDFTATRIAGYKKPRIVEFVEKLPLTDTGDVDRARVKALYS